jgi:hypothetical protein
VCGKVRQAMGLDDGGSIGHDCTKVELDNYWPISPSWNECSRFPGATRGRTGYDFRYGGAPSHCGPTCLASGYLRRSAPIVSKQAATTWFGAKVKKEARPSYFGKITTAAANLNLYGLALAQGA